MNNSKPRTQRSSQPSAKKNSNPNKKRTQSRNKTKRVQQAKPRTTETVQVPLKIDALSHDGRGIAMYGNGFGESDGHKADQHGKKVFVNFALPGETVMVNITNSRSKFDQGDCIQVTEQAHQARQNQLCASYTKCGGCNLQHFAPDEQIQHKHNVLAQQFARQQMQDGTPIQPQQWLEPLVADRVQYRSKARIGVRYIAKTDTTIIGFRERATNHLIDVSHCPILHDDFAKHYKSFRQLLLGLEARKHIGHIEVAVGEKLLETDAQNLPDASHSTAILIRHLQPLDNADITVLQAFCAQKQWQLYLQGSFNDTRQRTNQQSKKNHKVVQNKTDNQKTAKQTTGIIRVATDAVDKVQDNNTQVCTSTGFGNLYYQLPDFDLTMAFVPTDFTQVNYSVNRKMIARACELLSLKQGETVLDLFSGLGNFSLPIARIVGGNDGTQGKVIGVEGSKAMQQRATNNAKLNGLHNTEFFAQDLTQDLAKTAWAQNTFDAILIDPPRAGAYEIVKQIARFDAQRIVYVACDPATLARDTAVLIENGYELTHAGVMDMFCHTGHVESIARFEKITPVETVDAL